MGVTAGAITLGDVLTGAAVGGGVSAITGGDPLQGALMGGAGGAFGDVIGAVGGAAGGTSIPIDFANAAGPGITSIGSDLAGGGINLASGSLAGAATDALAGASGSVGNLFDSAASSGFPSATGGATAGGTSIPIDSTNAAGPGITGMSNNLAGGGINLASGSLNTSATNAISNSAGSLGSEISGSSSAMDSGFSSFDSSFPGKSSGIDYSVAPTDTIEPGIDLKKIASKAPLNLPDNNQPQQQPQSPGVIQGAMDKAVKYGPLAFAGYNALTAPAAANKQAAAIGNIGSTQKDLANQMISQAQSGQINPADQYAIDSWEKGAIAQARQYYAQAGLSDSSMANGAISDIQARAVALKEQSRQTLLQTGMTALNTVDQYTAAAIQAQMQGDQAAAAQSSNFLNAYGQWLKTYVSPSTTPNAPAPAAASSF